MVYSEITGILAWRNGVMPASGLHHRSLLFMQIKGSLSMVNFGW